MDWFENEFGSKENDKNIILSSRTNIQASEFVLQTLEKPGQETKFFEVGKFECLSVNHLTTQSRIDEKADISMSLSYVLCDVKDLIMDPANADNVFQVSTRVNCLQRKEKIDLKKGENPSAISYYNRFQTQGNACAVACPIGTIFRNNYYNSNVQIAYSIPNKKKYLTLDMFRNEPYYLSIYKTNLLRNCSNSDIYFAFSKEVVEIMDDAKTKSLKPVDITRLDPVVTITNNVQVGIHWNVPVRKPATHTVCQVFCASLKVETDNHLFPSWAKMYAAKIMDGNYEATLAVGANIINKRHTVNNMNRVKVFLTLVGSKNMGNPLDSIYESIVRAIDKFKTFPIDVVIVFHGITQLSMDNRMKTLKSLLKIKKIVLKDPNADKSAPKIDNIAQNILARQNHLEEEEKLEIATSSPSTWIPHPFLTQEIGFRIFDPLLYERNSNTGVSNFLQTGHVSAYLFAESNP